MPLVTLTVGVLRMKRTQVTDADRLKLKRKTIVQLDDRQLENVTGGCGGDKKGTMCGGTRTSCYGA